MAGIGFELKRLFKKRSVFSTIFAGAYATIVTIGPNLIVILALNLMYLLPPYAEMAYRDREVLSSTILYVFIFALILVAGVNILLSKHMADKVYCEDYNGIASAVEAGNLLVAGLTALLGIPFGCAMYWVGHLPLYYIFIAYIFFSGLSFTFFYMSIITILKEYRKISYSFLGSFAVSLLLACVCVYWKLAPMRDIILLSLAVGFTLIAMLMCTRIQRTFPVHGETGWELLRSLKKNLPLVLANEFYVMGLYAHNFVFWFFSDFSIVTANVFRSAPTYDMATYLAMLSNISIQVVFVVNVETKFHMAYQTYCESVVGAADKDIRRAKRDMVETLRRETLYIIQIQAIVNILVYLAAIAVLPKLGIEGLMLTMYPVLSVAYMIIYLVQCLMIYLYYLNDVTGAAIAGFTLLAGVTIGSLIAVKLPAAQAGLGAAFGGLCAFTVCFFRIRHILIHLDDHIFGQGRIVPRVRSRGAHSVTTIYQFRKEGQEGSR
ncbi:MAG: exopolysaccharide Pel transporter PelG [Oscillospiraceae bacterium]|nr:exopolysaccharide Pel transporter PelG [Oscillospiraceae bacterium]